MMLLTLFVAQATADVELFARAYEHIATRAELEAVAPRPADELLRLANDDAKPAWVRQRAVRMLTLFPETPIEPLRLHKSAVIRRAVAPLLNQPELLLGDEDFTVREAAVRALKSRATLFNHLKGETHPRVRDAVILMLAK